ncbi:odorant receptor 85b-like [Onthophagus taurus]|uniref:odorant receptor 85b-like n=1 Tax=Onthophagus taurus TaxID=166361 RepID=UPI0039BDE426
MMFNTIGQRVIDANLFLAEAVYNLNWYDADVKLQKDVLIFLCLTQRVLNIKLGLFGIVSYNTMTLDLKRCYAWSRTISTLVLKKK